MSDDFDLMKYALGENGYMEEQFDSLFSEHLPEPTEQQHHPVNTLSTTANVSTC